MRITHGLLAVVLCAFCLSSCNEDEHDVSDVALIISPLASTKVELQSGDKYNYQCDLYTTHNYVKRLSVKSTDALSGDAVLLDTTFTENTSTYNFIYTAPQLDRDSLEVKLTFNAWDDAGNKCEVKRELKVKNKQVLLAEKSGIVLYASATGRPDALWFYDPSQTFNWKNSPDSVKADMYIVTDDFSLVDLRSKTAAKFVRNNSFDYAAATSLSIQAVYAGSVRTDVVNDLRTNDIILVGHDNKAEGVFRVSNIIRTDTDNERCLQLAFKGFQQ